GMGVVLRSAGGRRGASLRAMRRAALPRRVSTAGAACLGSIGFGEGNRRRPRAGARDCDRHAAVGGFSHRLRRASGRGRTGVMTTALWLLFALGVIGAFDTLYYHE